MDASLTWNITCPLSSSDWIVATIIEVSLYDGMNPLMQPGELQTIYVYELCGQPVTAHYPYPSDRRLQTAESDIRFKSIVTSICNSCEDIMFQDAEAALKSIVLGGSLTESIQKNSGNVITAVIGDTVVATYETISNPPTSSPSVAKSPTNRPTIKRVKTKKPTRKPKPQKPKSSKSSSTPGSKAGKGPKEPKGVLSLMIFFSCNVNSHSGMNLCSSLSRAQGTQGAQRAQGA